MLYVHNITKDIVSYRTLSFIIEYFVGITYNL